MADRYDRLRVIGQGTFGKAWLVQSKTSQRQYVLKEIRVKDMGEKDRHQAVNEVSILSRLNHKNVVRYREAFVSEGALNIVMAYANGGDLGDQIQKAKSSGTSLPENQIMRWFIQITFALAYIHNLRILHRDLKPQNIFLTKDDVIKIGDFGIARALKDSHDRASTAIGTPYYLSPEICRRQLYNQKSDMWALGCVLYELLSLCHPFEAEDFSFLVLEILRGKYKDIPSIYGPLPGDLVSVLLRVKSERRPSADQILSIPAVLPYVQEYTGRKRDTPSQDSTSSDISSIRQDSEHSISTTHVHNSVAERHGSNASALAQLVKQPRAASDCPRSSSHLETHNSQNGSRFVDDTPNHTRVAKECGNILEDDVFESAQPIKHAKENLPDYVTCRDKVNRRRISSVLRKNFVDGNGAKKIYSPSAQKTSGTKQKSTDVLKKCASVSSSIRLHRRKNSRTDEDNGTFSKEGIETVVKRRKYSCMTPVAPKIIKALETPRSENIRHCSRAIHEKSAGASPVLKVIGKQPLRSVNGVDGVRVPRRALHSQTRVINKEPNPKDNTISEPPIVKEMLPRKGSIPVNGNGINRNPPPRHGSRCNEEAIDLDGRKSRKLHNQQCNSDMNREERRTPSVISTGPNISEINIDKSRISAIRNTVATKVSKQSNVISVERHREVCEMLLACNPAGNSMTSPDGVQSKLELLKMFLERRLGNQDAVMAYELIAAMAMDGKPPEDVVNDLEEFLPSEAIVYIPLLIHVNCLEEWRVDSN